MPRIGQRAVDEQHAIAVIHTVIACPKVSPGQLKRELIAPLLAQHVAKDHLLRLPVVHRADPVKRAGHEAMEDVKAPPDRLMLLPRKRTGDRLHHRTLQLHIWFARDHADVRPQPKRQRAGRLQLQRVLDLRAPAQNQRALHERMLLLREAVRLLLDAAQHGPPDFVFLLRAHRLARHILPALLQLALERARAEVFQPARAQRRQLGNHLLKPPALHRLDRLVLPAPDKSLFLPEHVRPP